MKGEVTTPAHSSLVTEFKIVTMEKEIWKDIEGFDKYQVSNTGLVRSKERIANHIYGKAKRKSAVLKNYVRNTGYSYVTLYKNGKAKHHAVHRLVAEAFIPNPENKPQVNHLNSIRTDNNIKNLAWVTYSENIKHGYEFGNITPNTPWKGKFGEKHHASRGIIQMDMDGNEIATHIGIYHAARIIGVWPANIIKCCRGRLNSTGGFKFKYVTN